MKKVNKHIWEQKITHYLLTLFRYIPVKKNLGLKHASNYYANRELHTRSNPLIRSVERYSMLEGECQLHSVNLTTKICREDYEKIKKEIEKSAPGRRCNQIYYSYDENINNLYYTDCLYLGGHESFSYCSIEVLNHYNIEYYLVAKIAIKPETTKKIQNIDISHLKETYLKLTSFNIFKWKQIVLKEVTKKGIGLDIVRSELEEVHDASLSELNKVIKKLGVKIPPKKSVTTSLLITRRENTPYVIYEGDPKIERDTESTCGTAYRRKDETHVEKPMFHCDYIHDVDELCFKTTFDKITIINDSKGHYYDKNGFPETNFGLFNSHVESLILMDIEKRLFEIDDILNSCDLLELNKIEKKRKLLSKAILQADRLQTEVIIFSNLLKEGSDLRSGRKSKYEQICEITDFIRGNLEELKKIITEKSSILSDEISIKNLTIQRRLSYLVFLLAMIQLFSPIFEDNLKSLGKEINFNHSEFVDFFKSFNKE